MAEPALAGFEQNEATAGDLADAASVLAPLARNLESHRIDGTEVLAYSGDILNSSSAILSANPGGQPSTTQPIAGPCDSPKEVTVNR